MNKKGFTLAEMLIVLAILGIVGSLLIALVQFIIPDQNDAKIRKAYNTLFNSVSYLTNSDLYSSEGKLNKKNSGDAVDATYFCKHFADQLSTTGAVNCGGSGTKATSDAIEGVTNMVTLATNLDSACGTTCDSTECTPTCNNKTANRAVAFRTSDGIGWYGMSDNFGTQSLSDGLDYRYVVVCVDPDISDTTVCPAGFGVRQDGKIMVGNHAQQILDKTGKND